MPFPQSELDSVRNEFDSKNIDTCLENYIRVYLEKTFVRNVTVHLHCVENYPQNTLGSSIKSNVIPGKKYIILEINQECF